MRRLLRWLLILGLIAGALAGIAGPGMRWWKRGSQPHFLTAEMSRGPVEAVVNSTGTVKPVRSVSVGAFVSGPIAEVYVDFNCAVAEGDLLARIDPRLLAAAVARDEAALATQEAELARAEALLLQANRNEARARKLLAINKDYLSGTEMDQFVFTRMTQEAQRKLAIATIAQAKANLTNSRQNLEYTEIRSPVAGIIIERKVDPGQTVAASFQTPELFIVAPEMKKHMHVFASVDEADIGQIRAAQEQKRTVTFTVDAYPHDLFKGHVYQVRKSSTTTQNVVTYPVVIEAPNPDLKLLPGMTANITFQIAVKANVLRVPVAALRFTPPLANVRPEDRRYLEGVVAPDQREDAGGARMSASQKAALAKGRSRRIVWIQDSEESLLRAVPVVLGLTNNEFAELIGGDLVEGQALVTGLQPRSR